MHLRSDATRFLHLSLHLISPPQLKMWGEIQEKDVRKEETRKHVFSVMNWLTVQRKKDGEHKVRGQKWNNELIIYRNKSIIKDQCCSCVPERGENRAWRCWMLKEMTFIRLEFVFAFICNVQIIRVHSNLVRSSVVSLYVMLLPVYRSGKQRTSLSRRLMHHFYLQSLECCF